MKIHKDPFNFPDHKFIKANKDFDKNNLFSIIIPTYTRDKYLKECVDSVLNQTYNNVEIIFVDHCASPGNKDIIKEYKKKFDNISVVEFTKNHGQWAVIPVIWNAGLFYSNGKYVYVLSDDDYLSSNYVERMMKIFKNDSRCYTSSPLPVSVNDKSIENPGSYLETNQRSTYTDGKELALNFILGWLNPKMKKFYSAPGGTMAIKRNILMILGGFDDNHDDSQILKYSIFGNVGFDPEAKLYWRHHSEQANNILKSKGNIFYNSTSNAIKASGYFYIWKKKFNKIENENLVKYTEFKKIFNIVGVLSETLRKKNLILLMIVVKNVIIECPLKIQLLVFCKLTSRIINFLKKKIIK